MRFYNLDWKRLGFLFKGVAQLVEQRSPKSHVIGSSPVTLAKLTSLVLTDWAFLLPQKQGGRDYENERCWDAIIYLVGI